MTRDPVVIDDRPLAVTDVVAISQGAPVSLGPAAMGRIAASRAVVETLVAGDALVYGLNTGLGHLRNERVPVAAIEAMQPVLVRGHAGAIGPALPEAIVRAAMAVRIAGIARGGSGASPAIAETYVAMLNAGVVPVVPVIGSVGASDLMHMAAIALVAMGEGVAEVGGRRLAGAAALADAGIAPLRLGAKDALTIISANGVSVGHGALVVDRVARAAEIADLVAAVSLEAAGANLSIVQPAVAAAKPVPGQAASAARILGLLAGSGLCSSGVATSVQDPLSFRVIPQVHGALREVVRFAREAVEGELAAMDDNPLVSIEAGSMTSNGNFHPMLLALAIDAIRPALAQVGQLSDRRMGHVWDRLASDPAIFTVEGLERLAPFGSPLLRYSGAARAAELVALAAPVSLAVGPLDLGVEDHATNAPLVVRRTDEAIGLLEDVLVIELLTATSSIGWREQAPESMAPGTRTVLDAVGEVLRGLGPDPSAAALHAAVRARIAG